MHSASVPSAGFVAAFVSGLAGFAFGLIVMPVWLHLMSPLQAAALIALYAMVLQGYQLWKLRHAIRVGRLLPLVVGGLVLMEERDNDTQAVPQLPFSSYYGLLSRSPSRQSPAIEEAVASGAPLPDSARVPADNPR